MNARSGLTGAAAAALLLLGACDKKPTGQVVAVVNGQEITQQELNSELGGATIPPGADKQKALSQLLQRVIDRKLVVAKAKAEGLDQSPAYLDQANRAQESVLASLLAQKLSKGQPLPEPAAVDKFIAANPALFAGRKVYALDQIIFPLTNDPVLAAKLRPVHTLEEVEAVLKSSGVRYAKGTSTLDSATMPPEVAARITALPPGEAFVVPQGGQLIANVIRGSQPKPTPDAEARPIATELLRRQAVAKSLEQAVAAERGSAKIEYQPGFAPSAKPTPAKP